ncbi:uncharacterized protein LOC121389064 [Gigantopelta aegis]|uniref:uncharacterized protein LOC121389064 n=1 Tax=Gigantopelta aegis TaxID=1735272 RepID=UPI001B889D96|nr:uncharacterized protein LOC121389064 [Gigantopelta aegis]
MSKVAVFGGDYVERLNRFCNGNLKVETGEYRFVGLGGLRTDNIPESLFDEVLLFAPDIVLVHCGEDDIKEGSSPKEIVQRLESIDERFKQHGVKRVIIVKFVRRGLNFAVYNKQMNSVNRRLKKIYGKDAIYSKVLYPKYYAEDQVYFSDGGLRRRVMKRVWVWVIVGILPPENCSSTPVVGTPSDFVRSDNYLDELCGQTINLGALTVPSCRLLLRRPEKHIKHFNCPMTVEAPPNTHMVIKVTSIYIASRFGCEKDYLQFLDGTSGIDVISPELCGSTPPEFSYVTGQSNVSVIFMKRLQFVADQFEVIFTAATKAPCQSGEFACDNDLCINERLQCNGFNNCGDGSDLCALSVGAIAGILIACIIALIVVALVLAIFVYRQRKKKMAKFERIIHTYSIDGSLPRDKKFNSMSSRVSDVYATIQKDRNSYKIHTLDPSSLTDYSKKPGPVGPDVMDHVVSFRAYPAPVPEKDELLFHSGSPQGTLLYNGHTVRPLLEKPSEETETKKPLSEKRGSFDLVTFYWSIMGCCSTLGVRVFMVYLQKPCRSRQLDLEPYSVGAGLVEVSDKDETYADYLQCSLTIRAAKGDNLMVQILRLDVEFSHLCKSDYLQIIDGTVYNNRPLDGIAFDWQNGHICGRRVYDKTYVSKTNYVTINFTSDSLTHYTGFTLMFTPFHTGVCTKNEFRCKNQRCIHRSLECTKYDHCGDNSNVCVPDDAATIIIAVVVGVVLVLLVLIVFTIRTVRSRAASEVQTGSEMISTGDVKPVNDNLEKPLLASDCYQSVHETVTAQLVQDAPV